MALPECSVISIIGHGRSPLGKKWGSRIDEHPVMRLKNPSWQKPEDYGVRCDFMAASTETMMVMLEHKRVPERYFAQPKRGTWASSTEQSFRQRAQAPLTIPLDTFLRWNAVFKTLHGGEVPNFSIGVFGIICCAEFLGAKEIRLVGFDNLLNPERLEYHKADRGKWVTRHDWAAENRMIPEIENAYGVKVSGFR